MKGRWIVWLAIAVVAISGCQTRDYGEYREAVEKTAALERYEERWQMSWKADFDLESIEDSLGQFELERISEFSIEMIEKTDKDTGLSHADGHLSYGGIGVDLDYFVTEEGAFLSMPFLEGYIRMDDLPEETFAAQDYGLWFSEESGEALMDLWLSVVTDDEVFKGERLLVDTPDGAVKTTKYSIEIGDEIFKQFIEEAAGILEEDEVFAEKGPSDALPEEMGLEVMLNHLKNSTLETFLQEVYVDRDGYVVREDLLVQLISEDPFFKGVTFEIHSELYSIGKTVSFDFPEITEDQVLSLDEMTEEGSWEFYFEGQ